ncbi:MAG: hypothetical protein ACRDT4_24680 [Micromonosporaceae bacterium]
MGTLIVVLERGFSGSHVRITVDGDEVLDATNITTDSGTGLAGSVAVDTGTRCAVTVSLPELGLAQALELDVDELTYLRVSLSDQDGLALAQLEEGPRYI